MVKAVTLAGGLGARISEGSHLRPKPMIEIGGKPILWHILKTIRTWASMVSSSAAATRAVLSRGTSPIFPEHVGRHIRHVE